MNRRVLCVDDEENVLRAFERNLRLHCEIETAVGPSLGLEAVRERGPYAVVVSDLRMPEMDGIQFLSAVRKLAPDSVRVILSGNADLQKAVATVNEGKIFQALSKPCPMDKLREAIDGALKQYRLVTAERELLDVTLNASIGMMTEALAAANPLAFDASSRIRRCMRHMAADLCFPNIWEFDAAAMLSHVGCVAVPSEIVEKYYAGAAMTAEEQQTFASHTIVGHRLLAAIPRLEAVAGMVRFQMTPFCELQTLHLPEAISAGAQMLMIAHQFDAITSHNGSWDAALRFLSDRPDTYQSSLVKSLACLDAVPEMETRTVRLRDLRPRMILNQDIRTPNGLLLVASGQVLSDSVIATLLNSRFAGWDGSFSVRVPVARPMMTEPGTITPDARLGAQ